MNAGKVNRKFSESSQEISLKGGGSSGARNESQVAKPGPATERAITIFPAISPSESADVEGFINKHDEKHDRENGSQGKPATNVMAERSAFTYHALCMQTVLSGLSTKGVPWNG